MRNHIPYLIVVIATGMLMLFLPISTVLITASGFDKSRAGAVEITALEKKQILDEGNPTTGKNVLLPLCIILTILNSLAILLFVKERSSLLKLCGLNYVFICGTIVFVFYYCDFQTSVKNILVVSNYHAGAVMPFVQLLFNFGALRTLRLRSA